MGVLFCFRFSIALKIILFLSIYIDTVGIMNGIIVLCHFCESHGPSTLFCTQSFHSTHDPLDVLEGNAPSECASYYEGSYRSFTSPASSDCGSMNGASSIAPSFRSVASAPNSSATCKTCESLEEGRMGFITNDHGAHISYISSRYPNNASLYSIVRQACVRGLSCEVCPGREGPVLFGDDKSGYVFSYTFKIKDGQARGFQRWYTIIVLMTDKNFLVSSWPFLVTHLRTVVDDIQAKASSVYESDKSNKMLNTGNAYGYVTLAPGQFRRRRGSSAGLRTLAELCGDVDLFAKLHSRFSWIMKACGSRLFEQQVEGPAMIANSLDASNLSPSKEWLDAQKMASLSHVDGKPMWLLNDLQPSRPEISSLVHLLRIVGKAAMRHIVDNVVVGNQLIVQGEKSEYIAPVICMIKELLPTGCCNIVPFDTKYHEEWECNFLGISNNAEIPSHVSPSSYVLLSVEKCDIDRCDACRLERAEHREQQQQTGLNHTSTSSSSSRLKPPSNMDKVISTAIPLEYSLNNALLNDDTCCRSGVGNSCSSELSSQRMAGDYCLKVKLGGSSEPRLLSSFSSGTGGYTTSYTRDIMELLSSGKCSDHLVRDVLLTFKEDWVNKSKIFFRFSRTKESESQANLSTFLKVMNVSPLDLPVLRFWTAALSKKDRTKLLVEHRD